MTVAIDHIPHRLTWEAFIELPEALLRHAELHDGEVVEMASPDRPHQLTLVNLIMALGSWVRAHGGELVPDPHVRIADYWGYQPDLAYYSPDRVPGSGYWKLAPNLAVEILSPSTRREDLLRKPTHYFSVGVQELWLVDSDTRVFHVLFPSGQYHQWGDGDSVSSPLLPGFEVAVTDLISQVS
jgi:Uma2 family endonuclease